MSFHGIERHGKLTVFLLLQDNHVKSVSLFSPKVLLSDFLPSAHVFTNDRVSKARESAPETALTLTERAFTTTPLTMVCSLAFWSRITIDLLTSAPPLAVLAAYSLGSSPLLLKDIYDLNSLESVSVTCTQTRATV